MCDEDNEWIYDSVVGFLNCPIWIVPIESFVDTHCLIFDDSIEGCEEHSALHLLYKNLVEELLEGFCTDLHITSEQFIAGCSQQGAAVITSYTKGMFEYVFASVNYRLFNSIMVRHNAALSLQALQMIKGSSCEGVASLEQEVMKFSEEEYQAKRQEWSARTQKEMADLEASLHKSRLDCETLLKDIEKDKTMLSDNINTPSVRDDPVSSQPPGPAVEDTTSKWMDEVKPALTAQVQEQKVESIEERRKYWLEQKKALVAAKRTQGLRTLSSQEAADRPTSARVAQKIIEAPSQASEVNRPPAMSKALATALRNEVINR